MEQHDTSIPPILYGTAWKENDTQRLVLSHGIIDADLEIWQAMETLVLDGKVNVLGISNVNIEQVEELCKRVSIKPSFNPIHADIKHTI